METAVIILPDSSSTNKNMNFSPGTENLNVRILQSYIYQVFACLAGAGLVICGIPANGQTTADGSETGEVRIVAIQGSVELMPEGATTWVFTQTNQVLHPGDETGHGVAPDT